MGCKTFLEYNGMYGHAYDPLSVIGTVAAASGKLTYHAEPRLFPMSQPDGFVRVE